MSRKIIVINVVVSITVLLLGNIYFKLARIEDQLEQMKASVNTSRSSIMSEVSSSMSEIKELMSPQNQLLMSYNIEYGELDQKTMQIPITVSLVPRQFEKGMVIELKVNDKRSKMEDTGTTFIQKIDTDLFKALSVEVILTKGDTRQVISLSKSEYIWGKYLLGIGGKYDGGTEYVNDSYQLLYSGDVRLDFSGDYATAKQVDIYSDMDGMKVLIASYNNLKGNQFFEKLNYKVPLKVGQMHYIYADIKDSMGLHYIYPLSEPMGINEKQEVIFNSSSGVEETSIAGSIKEIRDSNGKLLLAPKAN